MAAVTVAPTSDRLLRGGQPFFYLADTAWMALRADVLHFGRHVVGVRG